MEVVEESKEPEKFWTSVGGKTEYASLPYLKLQNRPLTRLFHCSEATGIIQVFPLSKSVLLSDILTGGRGLFFLTTGSGRH